MAVNTGIQWCDSTVNPTMGCDGCELWNKNNKTCYAGTLHVRWGGTSPGYAPTFEEVTEFPGRMKKAAGWASLTGKKRTTKGFEKPWLDGMPRLIFVSDMSDALSKSVTFEYLKQEIIDIVTTNAGKRHIWLWLTKQSPRMAQFASWLTERGIEWPTNLWPGTSVTSKATTARIGSLLKVGDENTTRFVSLEPQWEYVELDEYLPELDWVIQGGESGTNPTRFDLSWAYDMQISCDKAKTAYFLKQLGSYASRGGKRLYFEDSHAGEWDEWPEDIRIRQVPTV